MGLHVNVLVDERHAHKTLIDRDLDTGRIDTANNRVVVEYCSSLGHMRSEMHNVCLLVLCFHAMQDKVVQEWMDNAFEEDPRIRRNFAERHGPLRRERMPFAEDDHKLMCGNAKRSERRIRRRRGDLLRWRRISPYPMPGDWIFASPTMRGKQPYWPDNLMKRYIRPAARKAGIHKQIGWHTFRHTFGTLLKANGEDIKTVQELLRHANSRITLEVYTQAVTSQKRAAQSKVVRMMVQDVGTSRNIEQAHSA